MIRRHLVIATLLLAAWASRGEAQQQSAVQVPASVLERYAGQWIYPDGATVTLALRGGTLYREIQGQQVPLVPLSETLFRLGPVFTAEFLTDDEGGITQILTDGAATEFRLQRVGSPPAKLPTPPAPVLVPRPVLEQYVGIYDYIPGQMKRTDLTVEIRLAGSTLLRRNAAGEVVLTPLSETRFAVGNTMLVTEFVVDDAGVTQVMGSGFQQMLVRRRRRRAGPSRKPHRFADFP